MSKDGGILRLTGENCVTDVNYITVLNWLSYEQDLAREQKKESDRIMAQYKMRK